ncbi:glycoside hydrolase family 25 [Clostridium sp. MCC353]|nr:glycoside hydrolase family 25 [Clostridium sp. MCC353]
MRKKIWIISMAAGAVLILLAVLGIGILTKKIKPNLWLSGAYQVRGVDVSHYQGEIDWNALSGQGIQFAFIKASEGSGHVDENFAGNWENVKETGIYSGAYHFFSFDSPGDSQADLFISTVPKEEGRLAPAADVEFYGDKKVNRPDPQQVRQQLDIFLKRLEDHYGVKPVIYTTMTVYDSYIKGYYEEYPLWIRNVYYSPDFDMKGDWTFWQYSDTEKLDGYQGQEPYIDLNVFKGSVEDLEVFLQE